MQRLCSAFIVISFSCFVLAGCSSTQSSLGRVNASAIIAIRTVPALEESVRRRVEAVGTFFALDESAISAQVEGRVAKVLVDVGDEVKAGEVLVEIDPIELQYAVEMQRAAVRQVRAQLGIGPNDPPPSDPSKVAFVRRAAADLLDAKQKNDRAQLLFQSDLIPREQLDTSTAQYESARAAHELAVQQVDQLAAQLQSSEAMSRLAEKKLADASIRAPFAGSVKERRVDLGEFLKGVSATPVMVLVRTDQLRARLQVPEKWAGALRQGATVDVHVDAYPNEVFHGQLVHINPSVSLDSRSFEVEAIVPNPGNRLKPGFFVQASLPTEIEEKIVTLPGEALTYTFGTYKIYVVNGDRVAERSIKPGQQSDTPQGVRVEVTEGLHAGERVALASAGTTLFDGAAVHDQGR